VAQPSAIVQATLCGSVGEQSPYLEDLEVGLPAAAHATAAGKALLSTMPSSRRRSYLEEQGLRPFTARDERRRGDEAVFGARPGQQQGEAEAVVVAARPPDEGEIVRGQREEAPQRLGVVASGTGGRHTGIVAGERQPSGHARRSHSRALRLAASRLSAIYRSRLRSERWPLKRLSSTSV